MLDEPATGLDRDAHTAIVDAIGAVARTGATVVHATHDHSDALRADHCVLLRAGRIIGQGDPDTVLAGSEALGPTRP